MADVTFFFDPACPWTWRASRWLTAVADTNDLAVEWRPFSLLALNGDADGPHRPVLRASHRALRLVERLHGDGRGEDAARFYTALGERTHEKGAPLDDRTVDDCAAGLGAEVGLDEAVAALDDTALDDGVRASTDAALAAAGPGIGSPVLVLPGARRGLHGPVLASVPDKAEALALWEAIAALAPIEAFFEVKRGRP